MISASLSPSVRIGDLAPKQGSRNCWARAIVGADGTSAHACKLRAQHRPADRIKRRIGARRRLDGLNGCILLLADDGDGVGEMVGLPDGLGCARGPFSSDGGFLDGPFLRVEGIEPEADAMQQPPDDGHCREAREDRQAKPQRGHLKHQTLIAITTSTTTMTDQPRNWLIGFRPIHTSVRMLKMLAFSDGTQRPIQFPKAVSAHPWRHSKPKDDARVQFVVQHAPAVFGARLPQLPALWRPRNFYL